MQRIVDAMMAVPGLIIVLAIMAVLGSSLNNVIIAIVIGMLAPVVRTVRSQVLSVKEMEHVVAARAIGAPSARIIVRHIMPNCLAIGRSLPPLDMGVLPGPATVQQGPGAARDAAGHARGAALALPG